MNLFKVVVDFAHEGNIHWALALLRFTKEHGVAVRVEQEDGPGGGWPEVTIVGTREQIAAVVRHRCGSDDVMFEDEMERVEEVTSWE